MLSDGTVHRSFDSLFAEPQFSGLESAAAIVGVLKSARESLAREVKVELGIIAEAANRALREAKNPGWEKVDAQFSKPTRLRPSKGADVFGRKYVLDFTRREIRPHPDTVKELADVPGMETETWIVTLATQRDSELPE